MGRIVWSHPAKDDLKEIVSYIHAESPAYAKSFALRLHERIIQLENFPNSGRLVPEDWTKTYKELIFANYRIIYRHDAGVVTIITIIHGARILRL